MYVERRHGTEGVNCDDIVKQGGKYQSSSCINSHDLARCLASHSTATQHTCMRRPSPLHLTLPNTRSPPHTLPTLDPLHFTLPTLDPLHLTFPNTRLPPPHTANTRPPPLHTAQHSTPSISHCPTLDPLYLTLPNTRQYTETPIINWGI
ncbi:hypothetical protein E2C01_078569 [Portunus trituberculatus]|uniref:Uncharacterized protein n=1 Tax=Portunus trituberculatus TaxID=210409 RepID=A0A5B7IP62_PORTR|nr:hypothetical protein [Portunus trituberculatus]